MHDTPARVAVEAGTPAPAAPHLAGRRLVIRADAGSAIGTGHVMRCLAIAEGWVAAGGTATLASRAVPDALASRYAAIGAAVEPVDRDDPAALAARADLLAVDGWGFDAGYLARAAAGPAALLVIDDMGDRAHYPGDILLNPGLHASPSMYAGRTAARLCLGPAWVPLRREFRASGASGDVAAAVRRILVLMGGADPDGHGIRALRGAATAAQSLSPAPSVRLVVGAANPRLAALRDLAAGCASDVAVLHDVRAMAPLLAGADLALSAGGSTLWELAALGTPMVLAALNDSETGPAAHLAALGGARYLGRFADLDEGGIADALVAVAGDPVARRRMRWLGRSLVDGRGVERLLTLAAGLIAARLVGTPSV